MSNVNTSHETQRPGRCCQNRHKDVRPRSLPTANEPDKSPLLGVLTGSCDTGSCDTPAVWHRLHPLTQLSAPNQWRSIASAAVLSTTLPSLSFLKLLAKGPSIGRAVESAECYTDSETPSREKQTRLKPCLVKANSFKDTLLRKPCRVKVTVLLEPCLLTLGFFIR